MPSVERVRRRRVLSMAVGGLLSGTSISPALADAGRLTIYAPFALMGALDAAAAYFRAAKGMSVRVVYGPSFGLDELLRRGAAVDILFTADAKWIDLAQADGLIRPRTRIDLLASRLVLVRRRMNPGREVDLGDGMQLSDFLGADGKLAMCDPRDAPEGRAGLASLRTMRLWSAVETRAEFAATGKDAVALVAQGDASLGIVFDTDAAQEPRVEIAGVFPDGSHPPIVFSFALTAAASRAAADFAILLESADAAAIFRRLGFEILSPR